MCLKEYLRNNLTGKWDCDRQIDDAFVTDCCVGRIPLTVENNKLFDYLNEKMEKEDKNLFRRLIWWYVERSRKSRSTKP